MGTTPLPRKEMARILEGVGAETPGYLGRCELGVRTPEL